MPLNWTPDLAVGMPMIDGQHKEIFLRANILQLAINKGKPEKDLIEMMTFLEQYLVMHFGLEEQQMLQAKYPDYATHKAQHDVFIANYAELRKEYNVTGTTGVLAERVENLVREWIATHIQQADKAMAVFLRGR